jgi:hypothetical protein
VRHIRHHLRSAVEGRKDQLHHALAASLLLYCIALGGLEWVYLPEDVVIRALL